MTSAIHFAGKPNWLERVATMTVTTAPAMPGVIIDLELRNWSIFVLTEVDCKVEAIAHCTGKPSACLAAASRRLVRMKSRIR